MADTVALALTTATAATVMAATHAYLSSFWAAVILGMVLSKAVQMAVSFAIGAVLGSIETMLPATIAAMGATALVCLSGFTAHFSVAVAAAVGALFGSAVSLWLRRYDAACVRRFDPWALEDVRQ